ncbi:nitric oxide reductase transcriptional regulator NorR [Aliivibrio sifiae]|uniref:Nitric oxide reductase transcription regulator n=1 Tax=Aliivibrio sifiae TaxID=566293 RepID=A0A2S7XH44_9GAMM|nr:nitric oxide reductase transcriptional regulator NorR [Aliivibrio sifiae]PQJ92923.1 nitric oxide reductase transcription regulator [Aliivibrio sifiae]GLR75010.1 anaerobic nitric oxide reductase transcription regulator NorR [Aliivibrio sifiae]
MKNIKDEWVQIALDLTSGLSNKDRFERLLSTIRKALQCDASALLLFKNQYFSPLATNGLDSDVIGRRFSVSQHPRLEAIARAGDIVRFPSDSDLPDPYDGLIANTKSELHVHSCIGLPLLVNERLIGAVTIDAFDPLQFDKFTNKELRIISALAATSLHTALLMERLENQSGESSNNSSFENSQSNTIDMIGESTAMQELQTNINAVANTELSVLITGETGVGKELVASALHERSSRKKQNLVYLNCAALPESVAESELFGHVKGAFTGAISNRKGKFESADNGTLFLDEIGELSLALQAKLLRVLQYGDIQRIGDDNHIKVNTRIIAATNKTLSEEVKNGHFRADLYHRLSVFPIFVPPLRDRGSDITLLTGYFAEKSRIKLGGSSIRITPEAIALLNAYSWPGNIRELEHVISRAAVLSRAQSNDSDLILTPVHFSIKKDTNTENKLIEQKDSISLEKTTDLRSATDEFQATLIKKTYLEQQQNWAATARVLQLDTGNLHRLAKRLNLKG